jgi:hypothetical protein
VGLQTGYNDGKSVEILKIDTSPAGSASSAWAVPTGEEVFVLKAAGVTEGRGIGGGK